MQEQYISNASLVLLNPAKEACVKCGLSSRELRGAPLLGHGDQESTQKSWQAPQATVRGADSSQSCLSTVVTSVQRRDLPLCFQ